MTIRRSRKEGKQDGGRDGGRDRDRGRDRDGEEEEKVVAGEARAVVSTLGRRERYLALAGSGKTTCKVRPHSAVVVSSVYCVQCA